MTRYPTDDQSAAGRCTRKGSPGDTPAQVLDALAAELGKLAAERDYAKVETTEDKADSDGLSSPTRGSAP